jgi:hypothetical protein
MQLNTWLWQEEVDLEELVEEVELVDLEVIVAYPLYLL